MGDTMNKSSGSIMEWAEELENFLGSDDATEPSLRQQKEIILQSIARQMIKSSDETEEETEGVVSVSRMEGKSCKASQSRYIIYLVLVCIVSFGLIKYGYCQGKSLKLCWNNNIQDWIYLVLRAVRLLALPVIQYFPSVSDVHEDTCVVENPLYWDQEVDCSLCQEVSIVTLSEAQCQPSLFEELFYHNGVPVVIQDAVRVPVSLSTLHHLYNQHREDITAGSAGRLESAPPGLDSLDQLLAASEEHLANMQHCIQWRLLRVSAVRHLRQLFVRPYFISKKTEVALHRYVYICGDEGERFLMPMTEFANVWISQHSGTRQVQLTPSSECSAICRPVSALLRPGETLFYNWRYWRAISLPMGAGLLRGVDTSPDESQDSEAASSAESRESQVTPPAESHEMKATSSAATWESTGTCSTSDSWERWQYAQAESLEKTRASPSAPGEYPKPTDHVRHAGGQGFAAGGQDTSEATVLSSDRGGVAEEGEAATARARSVEVSPSPPEPAVSITFVGSFY